MRPELAAIAAGQQGLVLRAQARECGYSERELRTLTRPRGEWVRVRRGVYVERELWAGLDEDGRYTLGAHAVALSVQCDGVLSHTSAAAVNRMPLRPLWRELHHVTRSDAHGGRTDHGVKHHPAALPPDQIEVVHGIDVTGRARTAVDIAREHGFEDGVVAADAALRGGATKARLGAVLEPMTYWPGTAAARAAVRVADAGAESIGESLTRLLVMELGQGMPETQYEVREGGRVAFADLRLGWHLFEFDGKVKYLGRERRRFDDNRTPEEILWAEKQREDWLRSLGYGVSRVIWRELFGPARAETLARLAREYGATCRRYQDRMLPVPPASKASLTLPRR